MKAPGMSWVPSTAINDLSANLGYLNQEEVDEVLNSLTVSRIYNGVTHYRLSDVERAIQQFGNADQNSLIHLRMAAIVISNGNGQTQARFASPINGNGMNGNGRRPIDFDDIVRPDNGNGRPRPIDFDNGNGRPQPLQPPTDGGIYIYMDAETFRSLFRPCQ